MKITQIHTNKPQSLSFEIFPPKKEEDFKNIDEMLEILCDCHPEYISVTFGAGGSSNNNKTIEIAKKSRTGTMWSRSYTLHVCAITRQR